jgi:hypothetical protein
MDLHALQQFNLQTVNLALALWFQVQLTQAELTRLNNRVVNAAANGNSNPATALHGLRRSNSDRAVADGCVSFARRRGSNTYAPTLLS